MHHHHDCDVVIFIRRRHGQGTTTVRYGTRGAGVAFLGNDNGLSPSKDGALTLGLFSQFMNEYYARKSSDAINNCTQSDPIDATDTAAAATAETTTTTSTTVTAPITITAAMSDSDSQTTRATPFNNPSSTTPINNATSNTAINNSLSSTLFNISPSTTNNLSATLTTHLPTTTPVNSSPAIVFYKRGSVTLAIGQTHPERRVLHGAPLPPQYECVEVSWVEGRVEAPLVLGDPDENAYLSKGQFFALPRESLTSAQITYLSALHHE